jgi:hypothetical protein
MNEQLLPGGDDAYSSQASQSLQRSSSLLERIRAQRERETRAAAESSITDVEMNDSNLPGPNYTPIAMDAMGGGGNGSAASTSFDFSNFQFNFGGDQQGEASQGLLSSEENYGVSPNEYSMTAYFRMFVMDVYNFFRSLPIPVQAFLIVFLIWIAWKLIVPGNNFWTANCVQTSFRNIQLFHAARARTSRLCINFTHEHLNLCEPSSVDVPLTPQRGSQRETMYQFHFRLAVGYRR